MKAKPMRERGQILESRRAYQGKILEVKVDKVLEPGGVRTLREVVVHRGSVVVMPVFADDRVLLIRQYRHPARQALWELVAGSIETGESPLRAAKRELAEETGFRAKAFKPVFEFFSSPGFLTEKMYLIRASGLTKSHAHPEADERIRVQTFTRPELIRLLGGKRIRDAKTLIGILWHFGQPQARQAVKNRAK
jgi:ADP-ribose diphosphatase